MQSTSYIPGRWAGNPEDNKSCFKPNSNQRPWERRVTPCQRGKRNAVEISGADTLESSSIHNSDKKHNPRTAPKSSLRRTCRLLKGPAAQRNGWRPAAKQTQGKQSNSKKHFNRTRCRTPATVNNSSRTRQQEESGSRAAKPSMTQHETSTVGRPSQRTSAKEEISRQWCSPGIRRRTRTYFRGSAKS